MSRVKKRNIEKKKIKETIIGLSLAIFIGVAGSVGSYAYFSDRVEADNGIKITMGTLDTSIVGENNKYINGITHKNGDVSSEFTIKNQGSLDQLIDVTFSQVTSDNIKSKNIRYEITIKDKYGKTLDNVPNATGKLITSHRLNAGDYLNCTIKITNSTDIISNIYKNSEIKFKLEVNGTQINNI